MQDRREEGQKKKDMELTMVMEEAVAVGAEDVTVAVLVEEEVCAGKCS